MDIAPCLLTVHHPINRSKICYDQELQEFQKSAREADDITVYLIERRATVIKMNEVGAPRILLFNQTNLAPALRSGNETRSSQRKRSLE